MFKFNSNFVGKERQRLIGKMEDAVTVLNGKEFVANLQRAQRLKSPRCGDKGMKICSVHT